MKRARQALESYLINKPNILNELRRQNQITLLITLIRKNKNAGARLILKQLSDAEFDIISEMIGNALKTSYVILYV